MKISISCIVLLVLGTLNSSWSQTDEPPKVVLITLDGLRWQELFTGADTLLINNKDYVHNPAWLTEAFWRDTPEERRKALLPFIWGQVAQMGQIHGNRELGNQMDLTNTMWFSYPGYNEILTGKADDTRINSNNKIPNPNITLLEKYHQTREGNGKVAAFGSWDVFPFIINEERSGIPVNAGFEAATKDLSKKEIFLNELQEQIPSPWGSVRLDAFTHHYALEHLKKKHPRFLYIAYGETDDFAHDGDYQAYLRSARNTDAFIKQLWNFTQQDAFYKDQTVFLITTDHGRGTQPLETWKSHGASIKGAGQVWLIAFGKNVKARGEVTAKKQLYTSQIAPTVAKLLQLEWPGTPIQLD
ncbi:phosphoglyceromutase [Ascidiimonas aurantiaca]|uniref:phosphoglyceromutase n=1 Tax=Ascidiimonas aurantiaca TaxID=1685432 RepID=UPI0030EFA1D6